ncbi:hypothetical protein D9758_010954 [Tetrapyrgos nigripes]|uniref:TPR-like protein n=1 Tax=Tetrapyrgos nigripes TaxID=182062 RepID=A0A8H5CV11_9AGAR|nr:hypothetical protein D9758_010954 [Tetrapyrgos nigripes]
MSFEITADDLLLQTPQAPVVFTGRSHLVEEAVNILYGTKQVHIAILGAGGIGKTSVALHIMENPLIKEKFARRCYFIPCEMLPDATILIQGLVQAIGLRVAQGKGPLDVLLNYLKGCDNPLFILDNFETPWNSETQIEVKNLIEKICSFKSAAVVVTMRGTDGPGQIKWHKLGGQSGLPPLELGPSKKAFYSFSTDGNYAIKEDDPILEKLLIQMDGMPLAIMLIAELAKELPLNDLMEMWNIEKTAVLRKIGEQENRLTSIEVSIQLTVNILRGKLSATGEGVLRLVAFLPSGIPDWLKNLPKMLPDATMQVLILKKSCLIYETGDKTLKILTPIGEYIMKIFQGTEHLENQVWNFYESFINNLPQTSIAGDIQLELHVGNIFKILEIQIGKSFEKSHMNVLEKLCGYSQYYSSLVPLVEKYLGWKSQINLSEQTELMFIQSEMLRFIGEYEKAIGTINDVEGLYNYQINDEANILDAISTSTSSISINNRIEHTQADCHRRLGRIFYCQSNYTQSQEKIQQARDLYENISDVRGVAQCLQSLGDIHIILSQHEDAKMMLQEAKEQFEGVGDRLGAAECLKSLGDICRMLGQHEDAKIMLQEAKEQFEGFGSRQGVAKCLQSLGYICWMLYQHEEAKIMLQEAKEQFEGIGSRLEAVQCLQRLGDLCKMLYQHEDAKIMLQEAKEQFERVGDRLSAAQCLQSLGDICRMLGQHEDAKIMLQEAKEQFKGVGSRLGAAQCLQSLGDICLMLDHYKDAKVMLQEAKEQFEGVSDRLGTAQCLCILGTIDHQEAHVIEAKAKFEEAKEHFEAIQMPHGVAFCVDSLQQINHTLAVAAAN